MGCCQSSERVEEKQRHQEIEAQIKKDRAHMRTEIKMLLLGAGESGKSTILKQMKLIHDGGYSLEERESFKEVIFSNTMQSMRVTLEAMNALGIDFEYPANERHRRLILEAPPQVDYLGKELVEAISSLWDDRGVRACVARAKEFQLNDSAQYYFEEILRIGQLQYTPSDQDVLRSRVKSTGITETAFVIGDLTYRMFDVGGQRSERKKWIHCFENVTTLVFLVAISEYDQVLFEDESVNRLQEALTLFDSICNSRWFIKTSIILFLNKIDLFAEKLPKSPLRIYFDDYTGGDSYEAACQYLLQRFVSLNTRADSKQVYTHFTCATDTQQIRFVMAAVNDIIVHENLRHIGLL
ncbi:guanine nucleotide-binding protein subunit alpha [Apophysomyces sp. BC1034]|nr:guanine nucleotide-binding protein subunit alpha [Apophysomyces sp. BC1015]KAG0177434.1 guanine nucleotide-binding protein subunit alpha [Apophysomyces sp. BC1021]KAG0187730.1 guanine nucleotide-binding protein subunit alpha [Apophysomyces sp. BC1034]